jgi:excisionase family DNA binding protein
MAPRIGVAAPWLGACLARDAGHACPQLRHHARRLGNDTSPGSSRRTVGPATECPSGISPSGTARTGPAASPEAVTHAPPQAPHTAAQTDAAADANQSGQEGASSSAARPTSAVSQEALPSVGFDRTHTSKPKSSGLEVVELRVLTAEEVASVLRVDTALIITSITTGELPGNRIGGHWRIDQGALTRWLQGPYAERPGGDDSHLSLPRPSSLMTTVAAESTSQLEDSAESDGRAHDRS